MNFFLHPHVILVSGAYKGALYDLKRGGVFCISPKAKEILILLEKGTKFEDFNSNTAQVVENFLKQIQLA
jgi:hypothetical protein